ncbi:carboxymuconolactone decarboxylase family protein [Burkholderia gladioli]|uniref:Alkylhydroperoxidase n=1 Tax=Burkholderia gladioli TaxID=28095 RepID=A0A2A7SCI4_BURGA|nr:carboxymuconolactone decarboxylase family protein [Burkholderia gladioli]ATF89069.1 alkylhydroperoxidase [Burkholderia gladioli pv. gladioli]MBJ9712498.1 carboxymuconolactone decarboxylase family protein [Burkholderia gladioli]MBU9157633.1 carboxymuconolactone decarboxylase family protein [Burkholderia gladioli]MBU9198231.1 carboxymuconolactone decarboxylase family protein [Burkholderia gladioli]MBU9216074.1 carboxymuconolactone decarboxylase family protein [Burkholderia gladioli]
MSRLSTLAVADATGSTAELFTKIRKAVGKVPNAYATIGTHHPEALAAMLGIDAILAGGTLSKAEIETIKLAVSENAGCDYCIAAHTLAGKFAGLSPEAMRQIRAGEPTGDVKRDALVAYVRSVVSTRGTVPAEQLDHFIAAGFTERQVIEVSLAIASITFTNLVNRANDTTLDFPAVA